jgi:hypothetical protein
MFEKTFVDKVFYGFKSDGLTFQKRAEAKLLSLTEKRTRTLSQLALCLSTSLESIAISEGLDTWTSNQGLYEGEAFNKAAGKRYYFRSQSFQKSDTEIFTNLVVKELAGERK